MKKKKISELGLIISQLLAILGIYLLGFYAIYIGSITNDKITLIFGGMIIGVITTEVFNNIIFPFGLKYNKLILELKRGDDY